LTSSLMSAAPCRGCDLTAGNGDSTPRPTLLDQLYQTGTSERSTFLLPAYRKAPRALIRSLLRASAAAAAVMRRDARESANHSRDMALPAEPQIARHLGSGMCALLNRAMADPPRRRFMNRLMLTPVDF
jgi:hypothetical protein